MTTIKTRQTQLQTRLDELNSRLHGIEKTLDSPAPADDEDRATEREEDEVLERLGNAGLQEIQMIEAALARIDNGTYGDCAKCGDMIAAERLDLLPHAPLCRHCAA